jgi:hypothetical protein
MSTHPFFSALVRSPSPSGRLLAISVAGACLIFSAGCRDRDVATSDVAMVDDTAPVTAAGAPSPTRGPTGQGPDPETQGGFGMFEGNPGTAADAPRQNEYVSGYQTREPIPTEEWDGTAFGQEYSSAYTTEAETARAGEAGDSEALTEQRVRQELLQARESLALSEEQFEQIEISVNEGTVRLAGEVPDQRAADTLERQVAAMDGVRSVDNQLRPESAGAVAE